MDVPGVFFASLIIVVAIPFAIEIRRRGDDGTRTVTTTALVAMVLLGIVRLVKSVGLMVDGPAYWTLNISLSVLFFAMLYQLIRGRDAAHRKREGNVS